MAEALINDLGRGRYQAWSAGSVPVGYVHPKSIETLQRHGIDPCLPRSKKLNLFERYLNLWVAGCMVTGILIGKTLPDFVQTFRGVPSGVR
jgi:arsenate reductase (thioredoxin)